MIRLVLLLILLVFSPNIFAQKLPGLIPFNSDGKWGYCDSTGNIVLSAKWDEARLFHDKKAIVANLNKSRNHWIYSLIDENGDYIIPPSAGWDGDTTGHRANVTDSMGRKGLIDLNGRLLIGYHWDRIEYYPVEGEMRDSFMIVTKDGLQGVINRKEQLIIPCRWAEVSSNTSLASIHAFIVKDPDNKEGFNAYGVVNDRNEILLQPRYNKIKLLRLPSFGPIFEVSIAIDNQQPRNISYYPNPSGTFQKYFAYPSGKEVFPGDSFLNKYRQQDIRPGGYTFFRNNINYGIMDSAGNVIMPSKVWTLKGDTIFTQESEKLAKDSLKVVERKINLHTLQDFGTPEEYILYTAPPKSFDFNNYSRNVKSPPSVYIAGLSSSKFYKDSFLFCTVRYATVAYKTYKNDLIIVKGYVYPHGDQQQPYYAITDKNLNYVFPPENKYRILRYNKKDGILTIAKGNQYGLMDLSGKILLALQQHSISNAFRADGNVYGIDGLLEAAQEESHDFYSRNNHLPPIRILDNGGVFLKTLSSFTILAANTMDMLRSGRVIVTDSAQKLGLVALNGASLLPEVNFKFKKLYVLNRHYYFADSGNLINGKGVKIFKDFVLSDLHPSTGRGYYSNHDINIYNSPNRLYLVNGRDKKSGKNVHFYMNDEGIPYYSNP